MLRVGSDFSGVGALNQVLKRLGIDYDEVFACDMDKYARQTFIHNYGEPKYYPTDVYEREIPTEPLDLYVSSPPCQAFSLAGKRKGEEDKRGILFYNSHEFIMKNNPRYFIFENVKGLLSDSDGSTFNRWVEYLGGKSVNGMATMFPYDHSAPYHIYWEVLNAKDYNVPQNRERVFIIGIRDDADNDFRFPKPERLTKRLKDVLEIDVDEKYYLSEKMVEGFKGVDTNGAARTIRCGGGSSKDDKHNWDLIKIPSDTSKGYEIAEVGEDSINFEQPNSTTRRGRVGKQCAQTLTTSCNQGVAEFWNENSYLYEKATDVVYHNCDCGFSYLGFMSDMICPRCLKSQSSSTSEPSDEIKKAFYDENKERIDRYLNETYAKEYDHPKVAIGAIRGRNIDNPKSRESGLPTQQMLEINENGTSNALTTVQKDNVVVEYNDKRLNKFLKENKLESLELIDTYNQTSNTEITHTITCRVNASNNTFLSTNYRIRKLTPRECFRLMDFPDTFTWPVSDSQAYKQAGNSVVVKMYELLIKKLLTKNNPTEL